MTALPASVQARVYLLMPALRQHCPDWFAVQISAKHLLGSTGEPIRVWNASEHLRVHVQWPEQTGEIPVGLIPDQAKEPMQNLIAVAALQRWGSFQLSIDKLRGWIPKVTLDAYPQEEDR